jgi:hypothetical protein
MLCMLRLKSSRRLQGVPYSLKPQLQSSAIGHDRNTQNWTGRTQQRATNAVIATDQRAVVVAQGGTRQAHVACACAGHWTWPLDSSVYLFPTCSKDVSIKSFYITTECKHTFYLPGISVVLTQWQQQAPSNRLNPLAKKSNVCAACCT